MPELPEVETTVRFLRPGLEGRTIVGVRAIDYAPLVEPLTPQRFAAEITRRPITRVGRRGKYILLVLDGGDVLSVHLRMSGRLFLAPPDMPKDRHTRAIIDLDSDRALRFQNPRKFGRMRLLTPAEYADLDDRLGPEPLGPGFTAAGLAQQLHDRARARLKPLLLDQRFVAGIGNIYADEILFRAQLNPLRQGGELSPDEARKLYHAIVDVLREAIAAEGTTLSDSGFRFGWNQRGQFAERLRAYGRAGQACPRCGTEIERQKIAGRSTHFCPQCQN